MPYDVFVAMFVFAAVIAFTPGPNNIMVTASGVNFGFARTIPHLAGILIGFMVMLVGCAAGLGALFTAYAPLQIRAQDCRRGLHALAGLEGRQCAAGR